MRRTEEEKEEEEMNLKFFSEKSEATRNKHDFDSIALHQIQELIGSRGKLEDEEEEKEEEEEEIRGKDELAYLLSYHYP